MVAKSRRLLPAADARRNGRQCKTRTGHWEDGSGLVRHVQIFVGLGRCRIGLALPAPPLEPTAQAGFVIGILMAKKVFSTWDTFRRFNDVKIVMDRPYDRRLTLQKYDA